jgi:hypothetical protein
MKRTALALAAVAGAILLAAACGKDDAVPASAGAPTTSTTEDPDDTTATSGASTTTAPEDGAADGGGATATPEAELRADLAAQLEEHVYLGGITIDELVAGGPSAPAATAAAQALDDNSVALSETVGSALDPDVGEDFLRLWRDHVTAYVDYAAATQAGDTAGAAAVVGRLDVFSADTGELLESATDEELSADEVADDLDLHVSSVLAAIDATVAGSPDAVPLLREAASHVPDTAATLAAGMGAALSA